MPEPTGKEVGPPEGRTEELRGNLARTRARIEAACRAAARDPHDVTLVVVTKTYPVDDIRRLVQLGVSDVGENRDQEAKHKAEQAADLGLTWHFVGQLQTNKAGSVASYADMVHSVDRLRLVEALERGAARAAGVRSGVPLDCLVEVNLDPPQSREPGRGGADPEAARAIADAIAASAHLRLRGVMGVAPVGGDATAAFDVLAGVLESLRREHPALDVMSAGMSDDLEQAIAAGATHLRVGSAILGTRPPLG